MLGQKNDVKSHIRKGKKNISLVRKYLREEAPKKYNKKERNKLLNQSIAVGSGLAATTAVQGTVLPAYAKLAQSINTRLGWTGMKSLIPTVALNLGLAATGYQLIGKKVSRAVRNTQRESQDIRGTTDWGKLWKDNKKGIKRLAGFNRILSNFNKKEKDKKKIRTTALGAGYIAGGGLVTKQAVDSGIPRLLGVRLERHATSKGNAKKIMESGGYLDSRYGGNAQGITTKMKLPDEFMERSRGYNFISGANDTHPGKGVRDIIERSNINPKVKSTLLGTIDNITPIYNVGMRKYQVAGYKAASALNKPITDADVSKYRKLVAPYLEMQGNLHKAQGLDELAELEFAGAKSLTLSPEERKKDFLKELHKDTAERVKSIKRSENLQSKLYPDLSREERLKIRSDKIKELQERLQKGKALIKKNDLDSILQFSKEFGNNNILLGHKIADISEKNITTKLLFDERAKNPWNFLQGELKGKELFVPGIDETFRKGFEFDPDDPFPVLGGGNALKTQNKVRVYNSRLGATKGFLKELGEGDIKKGIVKAIKSNPKRSLAGAALLLGGTALGGAIVNEGANILHNKPNKDYIKVKSHIRKQNGKVFGIKSYGYKNKRK